jgi:xylulokinase
VRAFFVRRNRERLMSRILAIDLGTTYFKISLFDRDGRLLHTCRVAPPLVVPRDGWLELPVDGFEQTIIDGIGELRSRVHGGTDDVEAVTFATQTNSFTLLDDADRPLTPLILWPDRRGLLREDETRRRCDSPEFAATTGLPSISLEFMAAKLLWLQTESPDVWCRARRLCLISDYLTLLLTGKHVTEAGAAGLTGFVDIHRCDWHSEQLNRFAIDQRLLSSIVRAGTDLGPITLDAARRFGLPEKCRLIVGCLDQYAGAIGTGTVEPGMISETTGTVLATVQCCDQFDGCTRTGIYQGPAHRAGLYWKMTFGDVSANYLEAFRSQLPDRPEFDELVALAANVKPGAAGLRLKTDACSRQTAEFFTGLDARHTRGHQVRCILEAVGGALADQVDSLADGRPPSEIRCAGGAARSDLWLQIKADVLGIATRATQCPEPTSMGAAILAEAALSGDDLAAVARRWVRVGPPHQPDAQRQLGYRQLRCR